MRAASCLLCVAMLASGCWQERVVRDSWADFAERTGAQMGPPGRAAAEQRAADPTGGQGWSIRLTEFRGPGRMKQAQNLVRKLQIEAELQRLFVEDARNVTTVFYGRFADPDDPDAKFKLRDIQAVTLDERKPFTGAKLVALVGDGRIFADPFDLKQFTGYYSFQVGFYDPNYPGDFRLAAEQAAQALRADGDEAYFYHGPQRSIVTVGLFEREQAFELVDNPLAPGTSIERWSAPVRELAKKYPYNLGNGRTLVQKIGGQSIGEQRSSLILVPRLLPRDS